MSSLLITRPKQFLRILLNIHAAISQIGDTSGTKLWLFHPVYMDRAKVGYKRGTGEIISKVVLEKIKNITSENKTK